MCINCSLNRIGNMGYTLVDKGLDNSYPDTGLVTFEFTLGLIIASLRGFPLYFENQKNKLWVHTQQQTINGKNIAIIGNGGIGQKFRYLNFIFPQSNIEIFSKTGSPGSQKVENFFFSIEKYDVIVVLIPLNNETKNMFNRNIFTRIKDNALFVNMSYGEIVNTDDLIEELMKDRFFAALDQVYPTPLPPEHALWNCPNLILTPHVASNAR